MPKGPRSGGSSSRPELSPKDQRYADSMLADTYTFWKETDPWPIYEQPHREMFGIFDTAGADMTKKRTTPTSTMLLAPRFSIKTYGAAKSIARKIIKYPDISIGIFRSTREEGRKLVALVKNVLRSKKVVQYFGDPYFEAEKWSEDAIITPWRTVSRTDPTLFTMGTSGTSTGNHPDEIYGDDLVTEVNADSVKVQESLWGYIEAFEPQLPAHGGLLLTGTRWSEIDCYGRVEGLNEAARRHGVPDEKLPWKTYIFEAKWQLPDGSWKYYFPDSLNEDRLIALRSRVDVRKYNAWMFNRMVDPAEKPFKEAHIQKFSGPYKFDRPFKRTIQLLDPEYGGEKIRLYVALIIDPALTDETGSCGYGFSVVGFDKLRRMFTLESRERVLLPSRAFEIAKGMLLNYQPNRVVIESAGGDPWFVAEIGGLIEREGMDCTVQAFSALQHEKLGHRAKHQRIRAMEKHVTNDECFFRVADHPKDVDQYGGYCYDLLQQIDKWPSLVRNDAIDSWAMARYVLPYVPTDDYEYEEVEDRSNPPEWDFSWTDATGAKHGLSADKAAKLAMGPPSGVDPARWLETLEYGTAAPGYRPGAATRTYLQNRRRTG